MGVPNKLAKYTAYKWTLQNIEFNYFDTFLITLILFFQNSDKKNIVLNNALNIQR